MRKSAPRCGDQGFGARDDLALGEGLGAPAENALGQAVALRDVEDGEALEERDGLGLVAILAGRAQARPWG